MKPVETGEKQFTDLSEVKAALGEKWPGFFNNFSTWFPAVNERSGSDLRGWIKHFGQIDSAFIEVYPGKEEIYSEKFLKQTPRDFFETIDKITLELGISPERIRELKILKLKTGSADLRIQYSEQLQELIAPVYFRLRKMGYGDLELTI